MNTDDPYRLDGKSPRHVLPQARRGIAVQRGRMRAHLIVLLIGLAAVVVGFFSPGLGRFALFAGLFVVPLALLSYFADRHLKIWNERRVAECERRLGDPGAGGPPTRP